MKSFPVLLGLVLALGLTASCIFVAEGKSSTDLEICADCGQYAGTEVCSSGAGEEGVKCGKIYGSPGCCK